MSVSSLNWDHHLSSVQNCFSSALNDPIYSDVTLVSDDFKSFQGHKVILSSCSKVFMELLKLSNPQTSSMIYLKGFTSNQISNILKFIYQGCVEVPTTDLSSFVEKAEELQLLNIKTKKDNLSNVVNNDKIEESCKEVNARLSEDSMNDKIEESYKEVNAELNEDSMKKEKPDFSNPDEICDEVNQILAQAQDYPGISSYFEENFTMTTDESENHNPTIEDENTEGQENAVIVNSEEPDPEKKIFKSDPHIESLLAEVHSYKGFHHCPHSGCDYKAKRKELIRNHLSSTHGGPKFHCPYESCNRIYSNGGNLRSHTKSYHSCDKCPEKYEFNKDLRKHKKALHPNPFMRY